MKKQTNIHKEISALYKMAQDRGNKILPNSPELEREVLGIMLLNEYECDKAFEIIGFPTGEDVPFYSQKNRMLFEIMRMIYQKKSHPSVSLVIPEITTRNLQNEIYSASELVGMFEYSGIAGKITDYCRELLLLHSKRKFIIQCEILAMKGYEGESTLDELMQESESKILELRADRKNYDVVKFGDINFRNADNFKEGYKTGIHSINDLIHNGKGFQGGEYIIIAARPSVGKTTFAININAHESLFGNGALFISLEMTTLQVGNKFFEFYTGVPHWKLDPKYEFSRLTEDEHEGIKLYDKNKDLYPVYIDDSSFLTPLAIRSQIIRCKRKFGIKAVFIDYIELIKPSERYSNSREREIAEVSAHIKAMAKEFDIPFFILSQLNRNSLQRADKRPTLADLRQSGSLEQDADTIIFLHDPIMATSGNADTERDVEWIVAKNRLGGLGSGMMKFHTLISKFEYSDMPTFEERQTEKTEQLKQPIATAAF